jgi:hypothetical protein
LHNWVRVAPLNFDNDGFIRLVAHYYALKNSLWQFSNSKIRDLRAVRLRTTPFPSISSEPAQFRDALAAHG